MVHVLLVGLGGFVGAICRFLFGASVERVVPANFPFPTLIINLSGSFLIGALITFLPRTSSSFYFLVPGLLGGFTTYSAFSSEIMQLLERQQYMQAGFYILTSVVGGLVLCYLGILSAKA